MKRFIAMIISILTLFSLTVPAWAVKSSYADMSGGEWYAERAETLREKAIMVGVGDNRFAPNGIFTRSQLATVLYRMAGCPAVFGADHFSDTKSGQWYSDGVLWATQTGVMEGYDNGLFGVEDPVTQEMLALMLWRSAGSYVLGEEYASAEGVETAASPWAVNAVRWARVDGLLTDAVPFVPTRSVTRGQAADMVQRYLQLLVHFTQVDAVSGATQASAAEKEEGQKELVLFIGETQVPVTWEDNSSVAALKALLPLTIQMTRYGRFEQVGSIGQSLPSSDSLIATDYGDIMLYANDQLVIFYGSNFFEYTRLGHIDLPQQELMALLNHGNLTITLTME